MTPLNRVLIEKAAADCGFEMTPLEVASGLTLRSARFPETVLVSQEAGGNFRIAASNPLLLGVEGAGAAVCVVGYSDLYAALKTASARARTLPDRVADLFKKAVSGMPSATEAERLAIQRIGQDLFRAALLDYWPGRCCVKGLSVPTLLRASHTKPWAKCANDEERLDVFNLKTAVGCARQCRDRRARQDATTRRADARKKEQRRMARRARYWRVHSDVTQEVNFIEGKNAVPCGVAKVKERSTAVSRFIRR